jgi:hypothetical protein
VANFFSADRSETAVAFRRRLHLNSLAVGRRCAFQCPRARVHSLHAMAPPRPTVTVRCAQRRSARPPACDPRPIERDPGRLGTRRCRAAWGRFRSLSPSLPPPDSSYGRRLPASPALPRVHQQQHTCRTSARRPGHRLVATVREDRMHCTTRAPYDLRVYPTRPGREARVAICDFFFWRLQLAGDLPLPAGGRGRSLSLAAGTYVQGACMHLGGLATRVSAPSRANVRSSTPARRAGNFEEARGMIISFSFSERKTKGTRITPCDLARSRSLLVLG